MIDDVLSCRKCIGVVFDQGILLYNFRSGFQSETGYYNKTTLIINPSFFPFDYKEHFF